MRITTLNIHEFTDKESQDSQEKLAYMINTHKPDILALQEVTNNKELELFLQKLKTKYNYIYNRHTAILSIYPITNLLGNKTKERFTNGLIKLISNGLIFNIINVHLNYKDENIRLDELSNIMTICQGNLSKYPTILLGDFNALTKNDYSKKELARIYKERRFSKWELPVYELTDAIKRQYSFTDTRSICVKKNGETGTSRFNTRIDYIYINKTLKNKIIKNKIISNHIFTQDKITDHNMVEIIF